jgi:serine/threonine protein kinase
MEGTNLYNFLRNESIPEEKRSITSQQLKELLNKLAEHNITHGDLKHSNILITKNGPVLTDLDSMRTHRFSWMFKIRRTKDLQHFT